MKNYYAILELPVGCGVAEIAQAYRRLAEETGDNEVIVADLNEAYAVLTTPARRADYDRAVWGETFAEAPPAHPNETPETGGAGSGEASPLTPPGLGEGGLPVPSALGAAGNRCPMGAEAQCPVLLGRVGPADTFCPECGYALAGLNGAQGFDQAGAADVGDGLRLEEPGGRSHRLRPGLNTVGRETADVLLPDKTVSRRHARLEVGDDGTVTVEDLSSTNGTQVSGDILVPHMIRRLQAGDRVRFGSVVTELRLPTAEGAALPGLGAGGAAPNPGGASGDGAEATPGPSPAPPALGAGGVRAQVVETREEGGRTFALVPGVTTFGRRAENSVILQGDPYVSGSHAQILADGDLFRLTDIGSTNGTLLNGRRLAINDPVALSEGDVILIGGTPMRFERLDVSEEAVPEKSVSEEAAAQEVPVVEDAQTEDAPKDAPKDAPTEPENVPAEPRQRMAQEYDVPEDDADNGIPTRAAPAHDALKPDALKPDPLTGDPPTTLER